ncbi:MAG: Oxidoreductase protein [Burkholderia sp.]|nr:Oxidoreductase protein [Burkholderia sp.]
MPATLNIIGCGNVGKTLGRLWSRNDTYLVQDVLNRSIESAQSAVAFIGSGRAVGEYADLRPADITMIAASDDQILKCGEKLVHSGRLSPDTIVFHCSGALRSSALQSAVHGAAVASVHPIRSFAAPEQIANDFTGTYCGVEGDPRAVDILTQGFAAIGARMVPINGDFKIIYHSAAVFACNYLVTLLDVAQQAYAKAGIPPEVALKLMEPLVRETVDNVFRLGPANALTGPIARGDLATAVKQYREVRNWNKWYARLYKQMGKLTAGLALRRRKSI